MTDLSILPRQNASSSYHPIKIGQLELAGNLFLAPVAGYSDRAFRSLCISYGANFTFTEMVSSEALTRGSGKTAEIMQRADNEEKYAVQLFGGDPARMRDAASLVIEKTHAECIDINAGCPVPKIVKTGAGSALTRDTDRLYTVLSSVVSAIAPTPVTVKIRSGWDESNLTWKEAAQAALSAGVSAITLHPRTRAQGYEGKARIELITELTALVHAVKPSVSVFASGDLFTPEDAKNLLDSSHCDGIMFARGAIGNPFIFSQTRSFLRTGFYHEIPAEERMLAGWKELSDLVADFGEMSACRIMRKRFSAYSRGITGGGTLRASIVSASTVHDYRKIFDSYGFPIE